MNISDFEILYEFKIKGDFILFKDDDFAEKIYLSNIPFRPGLYLVYSLNKE
jgi:hypothetical protein